MNLNYMAIATIDGYFNSTKCGNVELNHVISIVYLA